jgi:hypothetical protein
MSIEIVKINMGFALMMTALISFVGGFVFLLSEPTVSRAVTDTFTVRQQITDEISFLVSAADVTMAGTIAGITGGNATGSTYSVVQTNNATGYTMDIAFSGNPAMRGETTGNAAIVNYGTTSEPTYDFYLGSTSAVFGYTVSASSSTDLDPSFLDDGVACNTGSGTTSNTCWKGASTTNFRIINRATAANTGATTTIQFRVFVPNNPSPALDEDFYTATATLTALNQ